MGNTLTVPFRHSLGALVAVWALAGSSVVIAVTPIPNDQVFLEEARKWCGDANAESRNADYGPISEWDTSRVTDMSGAFYSLSSGSEVFVNGKKYRGLKACEDFNEDISKWDTSRVESMILMFSRNKKFDGNLNAWDTSKVRFFNQMFAYSEYKGVISAWDTSKADSFSLMFKDSKFNGNISAWDTSIATDFTSMFRNTPFSGDISAWDTSRATTFELMFEGSLFNGDISAWYTSTVSSLRFMFSESPFNGDISKWDTSRVTTFESMFETTKFNRDISKWDTSKATIFELFRFNTDFNQQYTAFWDTTRKSRSDQPCPSDLKPITNGPVAARCEGYDDTACNPSDNVCGPRATRCIAGYINAEGKAINTADAAEVTCVCRRPYSGDKCNTVGAPLTNDALRDAVLDWCDPSTRRTEPPIEDWNIGRLNSLDGVFRDISSCNNGLNIGEWNVEKIKSMEGTFENNELFSEDLSKWQVDGVENFKNTFAGATSFLMSDTARWNTGSVTSLDLVLQNQPCPAGFTPTTKNFGSVNERCGTVTDFCQGRGGQTCSGRGTCTKKLGFTQKPISQSCTSCDPGYGGATCEMFIPKHTGQLRTAVEEWCGATPSPLHPIGDWNLRDIEALDYVFAGIASCGNPLDIGAWNVSQIKSMKFTFSDSLFNEDISQWDVSNVVAMKGMFAGATAMSYSLQGWDRSNVKDCIDACPDGCLPVETCDEDSAGDEDSTVSGWSTAGPIFLVMLIMLGMLAAVAAAWALRKRARKSTKGAELAGEKSSWPVVAD